MAAYQVSGRVDGSGSCNSLAIGWHASSGYSRGAPLPYQPAGPATHCELLKASDLTHYDVPWRLLYVVSAGDVCIGLQDGSCIRLPNVPANTQLALSVSMFFSISTASVIACR
jgi:hypothetical protein